MRIANYIKAVGDGRDSQALFSALDKVEWDDVTEEERQ
jgi:hypothetical protein